MIDAFEILSNVNLDKKFEYCRQIITQNNPAFVHTVLQFLTIYSSYMPKYSYIGDNITPSLQLTNSEDSSPFQTTEVEALNPIINITVNITNKTLSIQFDNNTFNDLSYKQSGNGIVPEKGWPKLLGLHGAIPEQSGYLVAKIKYPTKKIAELLSSNNQVLLALEEVGLAGAFVAAETDIDKIIITAKGIIQSQRRLSK